ncbi:MAG: chitinase [Acidimicrobiales bacterium]
MTTTRYSRSRILLGIALILAIAAGGTIGVKQIVLMTQPAPAPWSAPYVDVTVTPTYPFQDTSSGRSRTTVLSFVVADRTQGCRPSWGAAYSLDRAAESLDLDRRISRLRSAGGSVIVSFGGLINDELALTCPDVDALAAAYRSVIDRYGITTVDFDIEGHALDDRESMERRAEALARVQADIRASGGRLAVWLTLPSTPAGLLDNGVSALTAMLAGGVDLGGVNAMTMDFGSSKPTDLPMVDAVEHALEATRVQLTATYRRSGVTLNAKSAWNKIGATPMIGQNDVPDEQFTVSDAHELRRFAEQHGIARLSMWSLNRDAPCTGADAGQTHSNTCSGVDQEPLDFTRVFAELTGTADASAALVTHSDAAPPADDPTTSPYPLWDGTAAYPVDYEVVRHGQVYRAKWFTQGDDPDTPAQPWETPWAVVGPVLATDRPATVTTLALGTHPDWDSTQLYAKGTQVLFHGLPYEARWVTQGDQPSTTYPVSPASPWKPLFKEPGRP